jgi:hypothetical protein
LAEAGKKYDLLIRNVRVVRPDADAPFDGDIGITGGKFAKVLPGLSRVKRRRSTTARAGSRFRAWSTRTCTPASMRRSPRTR